MRNNFRRSPRRLRVRSQAVSCGQQRWYRVTWRRIVTSYKNAVIRDDSPSTAFMHRVRFGNSCGSLRPSTSVLANAALCDGIRRENPLADSIER